VAAQLPAFEESITTLRWSKSESGWRCAWPVAAVVDVLQTPVTTLTIPGNPYVQFQTPNCGACDNVTAAAGYQITFTVRGSPAGIIPTPTPMTVAQNIGYVYFNVPQATSTGSYTITGSFPFFDPIWGKSAPLTTYAWNNNPGCNVGGTANTVLCITLGLNGAFGETVGNTGWTVTPIAGTVKASDGTAVCTTCTVLTTNQP